MKASDPSSRPLWRQLQPGAHGCGFKSLWQFDYGRTYDFVFDDKTRYSAGKSPRPILINLWYPTHRKGARNTMVYGDYLRIHSDLPQLARLSAELARFARATIVNEVLHLWGEQRQEVLLTSEEQEALQTLLETPTAAHRDAPMAKGRFPLILYMAGSGSSFEDSSVLCEFLASQGYVVIGSAFQQVDGSSLSVQGRGRAAGDIRYLVSFAQTLPCVDWDHIGMVGHSLGAQGALIYQSEPGCVVDATVSLDTTQDQHALAYPGWEPMTNAVKEGAANMTRPVLFVASPNVGFAMADTMPATPRYFLTLDGLYHDDFITHGSLDRWLKVRLAADTAREEAQADADLVWDRYTTLCETVLQFMDATLKEDPTALKTHMEQDRAQGFRGDRPHLDYLPPGEDGSNSDTASHSSPPSPRQMRQILRTQGVEAVVQALRDGWLPEPGGHERRLQYPAYERMFAFSVLYQLIAQGDTADAKILYEGYQEIGRQAGWPSEHLSQAFLAWGQMGRTVRTCFEYLLVLEPNNAEAERILKELDAVGKGDSR